LITLTLLSLALTVPIRPAVASVVNLQVTQPACSSPSFVPASVEVTVRVNVTSSNPIQNVTLYYRVVPVSQLGPIPQPRNLTLYNSTYMFPIVTLSNDTHEYTTQYLPHSSRSLNNTLLFGFVKTVDSAGNIAYSNDNNYPVQICYFTTPAPYARLDLSFYIADVNPRYLNMSASLGASLQNSETFSPITMSLYYPPYDIYLGQPQNNNVEFYYTQSKSVVLYYSGVTQLFPLDSYTYQFTLTLEPSLNYTEVTLNEMSFAPRNTLSHPINFASTTFTQEEDDSTWNLNSSAQFTPYSGPKQPASITITLDISRKSGQYTDIILVPLISVYSLLGLSVLMTRKNDLANRLVVYLTVFVFSYTLESGINSLVVSPVASGPSMGELLSLALIPCTVVLAGASMLRWMATQRRYQNAVDFAGVVSAGLVLWSFASFSVQRYVSSGGTFQLENVTYTLWNLGVFGFELTLALFLGGVVLFARRLFKAIPWRRFLVKNRPGMKWLADSLTFVLPPSLKILLTRRKRLHSRLLRTMQPPH